MDPLTLQKQIKDNAEDLNTYLRDLGNWETEIKKKDAELRGVDIHEEAYPDVRSATSKPKKCEKIIQETECSSKNSRISGFDYTAWDKLDVDKVCEEIESNEAQKARETALYEKERGNAYVKEENWDQAITCYNKAIKCCPNDAIFYANRALCFLKIKDFQKAEEDCTKAIELDAEYVKAWLRRYAARDGLGKLKQAKRDLEKVLALEPRNMHAKSKLEVLEQRLKTEKEKECTEAIQEITKSEGQFKGTEKEKECTEAIQEITKSEVAHESSSNPGKEQAGNEDPRLPWRVDKDRIIHPIHKAPHLRSKKPLRRITVVDDFNGQSASDKGDEEIASVSTAQSWEEKEFNPEIVTPVVREVGETEDLEPVITELPPSPKSSVQFLISWKALKMYPEMAFRYLKNINPEHLSQIFGDSLEISTLEEMLNIVGKNILSGIPSDETLLPQNYSTFAFLNSLTAIPRFSTLSMFLGIQEKMIARQLLAYCAENAECSTEEAADLALKYNL